MRLSWAEQGWDDYLYWQGQDKKTLKKINDLIKDIDRNGVAVGKGKPEQLKGDLQGYWSRRIDEKNRLVYEQMADGSLCIVGCRSHYDQ